MEAKELFREYLRMIQQSQDIIHKCRFDRSYDPVIIRTNQRIIEREERNIERYNRELDDLERQLRSK